MSVEGDEATTGRTTACVVAGLAALAVAAIVFELWRWSSHAPLSYTPERIGLAALLQSVISGGSGGSAFVAPAGSTSWESLLAGQPLHAGLLLALTRMTGDALVAIDVFALATFAVAAASAAWAASALGVSRLIALGIGVLYAFLPGHVLGAFRQPMVYALWAVPLTAHVAIATARGQALLWNGRTQSGSPSFAAAPPLIALIAGMSGWLVGVVAAVLIGGGSIIALVAGRRSAAASGIVLATVTLSVAAASLVWAGTAGVSGTDAAASRPYSEIVSESRVALADLVLPVPDHRVGALANSRAAYAARNPASDGASALGLVGACGLAVLVVVLGARVLRPRPVIGVTTLTAAALLAAGLMAVFGAGGLLQVAGTRIPALDRWTPVASFVGFLALVAMGRVGTALEERMRAARPRVVIVAVATAAVCAIGIADQTTPAAVPPYDEIAAAYTRDVERADTLAATVPPDGSVYLLPIPDPTRDSSGPIRDRLALYLQSDRVRVSADVSPDTVADWDQSLGLLRPAALAPSLAALGFDGIVIDRTGYADGGADAVSTMESVTRTTAEALDHDHAFISLGDYRSRLTDAVGAAALDQLRTAIIDGDGLPLGPFLPRLELLTSGLTEPVGIEEVPDESGRLAVIERRGLVRIVERSGELRSQPLLDLRGQLATGVPEQGLLGLAFHPQFAENGRLFVHYTRRNGDVVIDEFRASGLQVGRESRKEILVVEQPGPYHNGGQLAFGPDGYLYAGLGDGVMDFPSVGPLGTGQDRTTLLGSIIRIDVDVDPAAAVPYAIPDDNPFIHGPDRPELWVIGLRNPWRFSFDAATEDLFIADVGQLAVEEINVQRGGSRGGENYGWREMAGSSCFEDGACDPSSFELPIHEYQHGEGRCAVTGGFVYRGSQSNTMAGRYVFGDYCGGQIWSLDPATGAAIEWLDTDAVVSTFGQRDGELLLADYAQGSIFRLIMPQ